MHMTFSALFEYTQDPNTLLLVEYFYKGDKIEDPITFFEQHQGLFEFAFPSAEEIKIMISKNLLYNATHKLIISEYGFHLIKR